MRGRGRRQPGRWRTVTSSGADSPVLSMMSFDSFRWKEEDSAAIDTWVLLLAECMQDVGAAEPNKKTLCTSPYLSAGYNECKMANSCASK